MHISSLLFYQIIIVTCKPVGIPGPGLTQNGSGVKTDLKVNRGQTQEMTGRRNILGPGLTQNGSGVKTDLKVNRGQTQEMTGRRNIFIQNVLQTIYQYI